MLAVAAQDPAVAAVVSQGAAMDGLAAMTGRGAPPRDPGEPHEGVGRKARVLVPAVVRDCRLFDLYTGDVRDRSLDAQAEFLVRVLS